jgi:hypothetical protein
MLRKILYSETSYSSKLIIPLPEDYKEDIEKKVLFYHVNGKLQKVFEKNYIDPHKLLSIINSILKKKMDDPLELEANSFFILYLLNKTSEILNKGFQIETESVLFEGVIFSAFVPIFQKEELKNIKIIIKKIISKIDLLTLDDLKKQISVTDGSSVSSNFFYNMEFDFIDFFKEEIQESVRKMITDDQYEKIKSFVTVQSFFKRDVVESFLLTSKNRYSKEFKEFENGLPICNIEHFKSLIEANEIVSINDKDKSIINEIQIKNTIFLKNRVATIKQEFISDLDILDENFPHFKEVTSYIRRRAKFSVISNEFKIDPILIHGYYGIGKTEYFNQLSKILNIPRGYIDGTSIDSKIAMTGLSFKWCSGSIGMIFEKMFQLKCLNPFIIVDEVDKMGKGCGDGEIWSPFYALLEKETAKVFFDSALEAPIDASNINWVFVCNDPSLIPIGIKNRLQTFKISSPKATEKSNIIKSIFKDLQESGDFNDFNIQDLDDKIIDKLKTFELRPIKKMLKMGLENLIISNHDSNVKSKRKKLNLTLFNLNL